MAKQIIFREKAKEGLKRGIDAVADAVKITLGPKGRNVILEKGYGAPTITNDGVTIAKEIELRRLPKKWPEKRMIWRETAPLRPLF